MRRIPHMTGSNPDGFKPLFSEINPLYASSEDTPNIIMVQFYILLLPVRLSSFTRI